MYLDVSSTLQSLAFVAVYSVYSYLRHSKCESCLKILSEAKTFEIEEDMDNKYTLISLLDRGSLIWPSDRVLESTIYLWKILVRIEQQQYLMEKLISGPSRKILVQLVVQLIDENESEAWRDRCLECDKLGWDVLRKLLSSIINCLISNKVKNMNTLIRSKGEEKRKLMKLGID